MSGIKFIVGIVLIVLAFVIYLAPFYPFKGVDIAIRMFEGLLSFRFLITAIIGTIGAFVLHSAGND